MVFGVERSAKGMPTRLDRAHRVLIYGMNYSPEQTGVGRYTGEIGIHLAQQGSYVDVVTAVPHYPDWTVGSGYNNRFVVEHIASIRITRCPLLLKAKMRGVWRVMAPLTFALTSAPIIIWRILSVRPDSVLCVEPTLFAAPVALLAAKLIGARTVLHVQDLEIDAAFAVGHVRGRFLQRLANIVERAVLQSFDAVITISSRMQTSLESKGVSSDRLNLIRNWVDIDRIKPHDGPSRYRDDLEILDGSFVALYAGSIGPKQALPVILDAAERLAATSKPVFVIVGDGPEKNGLVARYGHLRNVRFLPTQPEERLCELLNFADVHLLSQDAAAADLVLPSKLGGMLASGKPCIVMTNPGTELFEFLGDGAIILPPGDVDALAKTIERIANNPEQCQLGSNSARIAALDAKKNLSALSKILDID